MIYWKGTTSKKGTVTLEANSLKELYTKLSAIGLIVVDREILTTGEGYMSSLTDEEYMSVIEEQCVAFDQKFAYDPNFEWELEFFDWGELKEFDLVDGEKLGEVVESCKGKYADIEVYRPSFCGSHEFKDGDLCSDYTETSKVNSYELMDVERYDEIILGDTDLTADFDDWFGDKDANVLCIMLE